jgi:hypothetical protein
MAAVRSSPGDNIIPARFCNPPIFKDHTGKRNGADMHSVLSFELLSVPNLYQYEDELFTFKYVEYDDRVDPNKGEVSEIECEPDDRPKVDIEFVEGNFTEFGINYLGKIVVNHVLENKFFEIKIIGEWTYDPAGVTTSMHASERVGGDCFSF